jgi:hypothetical protein
MSSRGRVRVLRSVAPAVGPFVVLFGEDGSDESDDRAPVGEDPDHVGAGAHLAVEPLVGIVGPDLAPHRSWERGEGQDLLAGCVEVVVYFGQRGLDLSQELVVLGVHGVGVDLVEH